MASDRIEIIFGLFKINGRIDIGGEVVDGASSSSRHSFPCLGANDI